MVPIDRHGDVAPLPPLPALVAPCSRNNYTCCSIQLLPLVHALLKAHVDMVLKPTCTKLHNHCCAGLSCEMLPSSRALEWHNISFNESCNWCTLSGQLVPGVRLFHEFSTLGPVVSRESCCYSTVTVTQHKAVASIHLSREPGTLLVACPGIKHARCFIVCASTRGWVHCAALQPTSSC